MHDYVFPSYVSAKIKPPDNPVNIHSSEPGGNLPSMRIRQISIARLAASQQFEETSKVTCAAQFPYVVQTKESPCLHYNAPNPYLSVTSQKSGSRSCRSKESYRKFCMSCQLLQRLHVSLATGCSLNKGGKIPCGSFSVILILPTFQPSWSRLDLYELIDRCYPSNTASFLYRSERRRSRNQPSTSGP